MFEPLDFLRLARRLADEAVAGPPEIAAARVRTAYGRAYYGLFLHVRAILVRRHRLPIRRIEHGALCRRLQFAACPAPLQRLGSELERLDQLRQKADYELTPAEYWDRKLDDAALARLLAGRALDLAIAAERLDFTPVANLLLT